MKSNLLEKFKKFTAIFVLVQMVFVLFPAPAAYAGDDGEGNDTDKIWICHATGNNTYNELYISKNAVKNGHSDHEDDIIPPFNGYDGKNWEEGEAIWSNDCVIPEPEIDDNIPPVFDHYDGITESATSIKGAFVDYPLPIATDDVDGNLEPDCAPAPGFQFPIGKTEVICTAVDKSGNSAELKFKVTVVDDVPIIELNGENPMYIEKGTPYVEPGATAHDAVDGEFGATPSGSVDTSVLGDNEIIYTAIDSSGNPATPVKRTVTVVDTIKPEFSFINPTPDNNKTLNANNFQVKIKGTEDIDYCKLNIAGEKHPMIPGSVSGEFYYDVGPLGDGTYKYKVICWDKAENKSHKSRYITIDTKGPNFDFIDPTPEDGTTIREDKFEVWIAGDEDIESCQIWLNEEDYKMDQDGETGNWFKDFMGLEDGNYEYWVRCTDKAGNNTDSEKRNLIIDTSEDNGNGDDNGDNGGTGGGTTPPVVLTPIVPLVSIATVPAVGATVDNEVQDVIAATTDKDEEEVLGEEVPGARDVCDWWWIISLILAVLLVGNYLLARRFEAQDIAKKILMVTPISLGLLALYAHQLLSKELDHSNWCDYLWLIIAVLVAAYYLVKNYLPKTEKAKKAKK